MMKTQERTVTAWCDRIETRVKIAGNGSPVLFVHSETGQWDPFLDALAQRHTVYAPEFPGTTPGHPDAIRAVDTLWDLVLYYDELLDALSLNSVALVGHSMGGMFAAEIAANNPARVSRLVLIAPAGLWIDSRPVPNWWSIPSEDLPARTLADPNGELARMMFTPPAEQNAAIEALIARTWSMACATKFAWPIPDKGLKKRIHRISAPTLIVWGKQDGLIPVEYAAEFASRIAKSRMFLVDRAGHIPHLEQFQTVLGEVIDFLH